MKNCLRASAERASRLGALGCLALCGCAGPRQEASRPAAGSAAAASEPAQIVSGNLNSSYRGRFAGGEDDHDLYETLDLALEDPGKRWSASVLARAALDLDGRDAGEDALFFSLQDTYDSRLEPDLYHAFVDVHRPELQLLRIGRQPLYETPLSVLFDGVRLETKPRGERHTRLGVYGGAGEHPYESSSEGDLVLGAFGLSSPWKGAALRADWMHLEDENLLGPHTNDLLGLSFWQDVVGAARSSRLEGRFTALEGNARDLRLSASHVEAEHGFSVQGSFYELLQTQNDLAQPLDPFTPTLFELFPYSQLSLSATKDWRTVALLAGADVRRVEDSADEGDFNHDFARGYGTATLAGDLPVSLALTGEVWNATDNDFETWGASLARELQPDLDLSLGSFYSLFQYDLFTNEERDHVRTYFVDLRWRPLRTRRWSLRYEYEQNDFDDFHQVRLDYSWGF